MDPYTDQQAYLALAIDAGCVWARWGRWYERDAFQDDNLIDHGPRMGLQRRAAVILVDVPGDTPWQRVMLSPGGQDELDRWLAAHGIGID